MIDVLIVEDEPAILMGIMQLVESLELPIEVQGGCGNGIDAMKLIGQKKPDVVITDIRMPGMNGLELIEKSQKSYPGIQYIVLSGYSEFEYAKKAIQYGVEEYILKPPVRGELYDVLKKLCDRIISKKEDEEKEALRGLIFNGITEDIKTPSGWGEGRCAYLFMVCAGPFSSWAEEFIHPDREVWGSSQMEEWLCGCLQGEDRCIVLEGRAENERLILLLASDHYIDPVKRLVNELSFYEKRLGMPVNMVISDALSSPGQLKGIYQQIRQCMANHALLGRSHACFLEREQEQGAVLAIHNDEKRKLESLLAQNEISGIIKLFERMCERWSAERISQSSCLFSIKYLLTEIYRSSPVLMKKYRMEELLYKADAAVGRSTDFPGLLEGISQIINELNKTARESRLNKRVEDVVDLLYEYILEHYAEPVPIEEFVRQFNYNANYIANQFSIIKGISVNRLITELRLEKAKEQLIHTDALLKDIAELVGYRDVSYFSRIFKEYTGLSPRQFRCRDDV